MVTANPVTITSGDGHSSDLRLFAPQTEANEVVLCLPAMGVPAHKYDAIAAAIAARGYRVAVGELRGVGSSSVRASRSVDFGYQNIIEYDIPAMHGWLAQEYPNAPVYLMGHSLGGQLATLYLSQQPDTVNGLILCASCTVFYRGWSFPKNIGVWIMSQSFATVATVLGYLPGKQLGFGGLEGKTVIRDWARNARTGKYRLSGTDVDYDQALSKVQLPVLAINYHDDGFAPMTATGNLLAKMPLANISRGILSADDLNAETADHFSWIRHPQASAAKIVEWIESQTMGGSSNYSGNAKSV